MNKQNAIRHYLSKAKKAVKRGDCPDELCGDIQGLISDRYCMYCIHEDFGYCGLRNSDMPDNEIGKKFCLPAMVKYLEKSLGV